jgi:hypothetical protein
MSLSLLFAPLYFIWRAKSLSILPNLKIFVNMWSDYCSRWRYYGSGLCVAETSDPDCACGSCSEEFSAEMETAYLFQTFSLKKFKLSLLLQEHDHDDRIKARKAAMDTNKHRDVMKRPRGP